MRDTDQVAGAFAKGGGARPTQANHAAGRLGRSLALQARAATPRVVARFLTVPLARPQVCLLYKAIGSPEPLGSCASRQG